MVFNNQRYVKPMPPLPNMPAPAPIDFGAQARRLALQKRVSIAAKTQPGARIAPVRPKPMVTVRDPQTGALLGMYEQGQAMPPSLRATYNTACAHDQACRAGLRRK